MWRGASFCSSVSVSWEDDSQSSLARFDVVFFLLRLRLLLFVRVLWIVSALVRVLCAFSIILVRRFEAADAKDAVLSTYVFIFVVW